jgi:hypothetical protein
MVSALSLEPDQRRNGHQLAGSSRRPSIVSPSVLNSSALLRRATQLCARPEIEQSTLPASKRAPSSRRDDTSIDR